MSICLHHHGVRGGHIHCLFAVQQQLAEFDAPPQVATVKTFRQVVGHPKLHRLSVIEKLKQRHQRLIHLGHLVIGFLRPQVVADNRLGPVGRHDVDEVELKIAADRPRRQPQSLGDIRPSRSA